MSELDKARLEINNFLLEVPKVKKLFQDENEMELRKIREGLARILGYDKQQSNDFVKNLEKNGKLTKIIRYPGTIYYKKKL